MTRVAKAPVLSLWRDYKDDVRRLPGMYLGTVAVSRPASAAAQEFYDGGVRRVALGTVADLTAAAEPDSVLGILDLIKELTAWGIVVEWRVRLDDTAPQWTMLSHLYPPVEVDGIVDAQRARAQWAAGFFLCKCHYRRGPGFLEVRDHRAGVLNRITIDESAYLAGVAALLGDPAAKAVPREITDAFVAEQLALEVGDLLWWAPNRPHRWAQPPFHV